MCHTWRAKEGRGKAKFETAVSRAVGASAKREREVLRTPVTRKDGRK
jgi:hypothetical protein